MRSTPTPKAPKAQPAGFDTIKILATHIAAHKGVIVRSGVWTNKIGGVSC